MRGPLEHVVAHGAFDDPALGHDRDAVAHVTHDGEVVGDEEVAHPALLLELQQEVEDLALDGDVQGGDRLVTDDELGFESERPSDADPLELAARERGRAAVAQGRVDTDALKQLVRAAATFGAVVEAVDVPGLGHDVRDREARVDRGEGVLVHELDVPAHPA